MEENLKKMLYRFSQNIINVSYWVEGNYSKGIVIGQDCDGCFVRCSKGDTIRGALKRRENGYGWKKLKTKYIHTVHLNMF